MLKIKICGMRRLEDIEIVNKYMPDYIGFVFAKSKRQITHQKARELNENLNSNITSVGVFVDAPSGEIINLFDDDIIKAAQLHGKESEDYILNLKEKTSDKLKIIKAVEINKDFDLKKYDNSNADYLLFDSGKGSGKTFNWDLIKNDIKKDFFIAGGLNSTNIKEAIGRFNPYGVDLSSSLETDSFKDEAKVKEIMELIKNE